MEIYNQIKKDIILLIIFWVMLNVVRTYFNINLDDSDYDDGVRSGLVVHTDALTGVQYLSKGNSLVVRVDSLGNIIHVK